MVCRRLIYVLLSGTLLGGCAFGDRVSKLQYPPPPEGGSAQAAVPLPSASLRSDERPIIVGRFVDRRTNKKKIGFVQNTFGMETANVFAANSVAEWMRAALVTELGLNGYSAKLGEGRNSPADRIVVTGEIQKVLTKAYFDYNSEVIFSADVKRADTSLSKKTYIGKGGGGINLAATEAGFGRSIALALQDALRRLVAEIGRVRGKPK